MFGRVLRSVSKAIGIGVGNRETPNNTLDLEIKNEGFSSNSTNPSSETPTEDEIPAVGPLPITKETTTNEAEVMKLTHIKLFRFDEATKEWINRGTCVLKIMKDINANKFRLLLFLNDYLVVVNHWLIKDQELKYHTNKRTLIWAASDFSDGFLQNRIFCAKFINEDIAEKFKAEVDKLF